MLTEILWVVKSKLFPSIPIRVGHNRRRNEETFFFSEKIHSIKNNFTKLPYYDLICYQPTILLVGINNNKNNIAGLAATYDDQVVFARTRRV